MSKIEVLTIHPLSADAQVKIRAVDAGVRLTDAGGWFAGEIRESWPPFAVKRNLSDKAQGSGTREERDELLSKAEIIYGGFPFPLDLCARAPNLKWFHNDQNCGISQKVSLKSINSVHIVFDLLLEGRAGWLRLAPPCSSWTIATNAREASQARGWRKAWRRRRAAVGALPRFQA